MSKPIMDESDIADELANLRAERNALVERLRLQPTVREIAGELRGVLTELADGLPNRARLKLAQLLRRLDESSETHTG
jgi:hypothetical protein